MGPYQGTLLMLSQTFQSERANSSTVLARLGWYRIAFAAILATAAVTRLWDLGSRAMHHDESLHAYFSWLLANGHGYIHDPMMHGPVLFHLVAAAFYLFGDSDTVSRLWPALLGIGVVAAPHFLRPWLGSKGAIIASGLLCLSPLTMYFSRFIRHDIFAEAWVLMALIGLLRYLTTGQTANLVVFGLGMGLLYSEKEVSYIYTVSVGLFLLPTLLIRTLPRTALAALVASTALTVLLVLGVSTSVLGPLPKVAYPISSYEQVLQITNSFASSPLVLTLVACTLAAFGTVAAVFHSEARRPGAHSIPWRDLTWTSASFAAVFVLFHTTFFQNPTGLFTGSIGAVAYWLGQQEVRRGDQPWYYYLVLIPIYEPLVLALGACALWPLASAVRKIRTWLKAPWVGPQNFGPLAGTWLATSLLLYSWAGEKMPWLSVHILLPAILLAAWGTQQLWDQPGQRRLLAPIVAAAGLILIPYQWRTAVQLSFYNGDTPKEMAIYTQTTPDVARLSRALDILSLYRNGGYQLSIAMDAEAAWPFQWYLRRYPKVTYLATGDSHLPAGVEVALLGTSPDLSAKDRYVVTRMPLRWWFPEETYRGLVSKTNGIMQAKELAQSVLEIVVNPQQRSKLLDFVFKRQTPPLGSTDFYLLVRTDLWPQFREAWRLAAP